MINFMYFTTVFKKYNSAIFSVFIELYNHHHYLISQQFHHPQKKQAGGTARLAPHGSCTILHSYRCMRVSREQFLNAAFSKLSLKGCVA